MDRSRSSFTRRWVALVLSWTPKDGLRVRDTETMSTRAIGLESEGLLCVGQSAYITSMGRLMALELVDTPDGVHVGTRVVAQIHRLATEIFPGCLVQNLLNTRYFTCLSETGAVHRRVPELDDYRIVDAAHMEGVLVVVALKAGRYHHFMVRFSEHGNHYRLVHQSNGDAVPATVIVTDTGIVVYQENQHELCIVHRDPKSSKRRRVPLGDVPNFRLWARPYGLGFVRNREMGTVRLKPTG